MKLKIDASAVPDRAGFHDAFAAVLPEWYGRNLDALYDCLTDLPEGEIAVLHPETLRENLGEYGAACLDTLQDAARDNPNLRLLLAEGDNETGMEAPDGTGTRDEIVMPDGAGISAPDGIDSLGVEETVSALEGVHAPGGTRRQKTTV